jgi:glucosamine-6-phosphate deaminase
MGATYDFEQLHVYVGESIEDMAEVAATGVATELTRLLDHQERVRTVFAAAWSQEAFLASLLERPGIEWGRVEVLQLDEYVGLRPDSPLALCHWLENHVTDRVPIARAEYMDGSAPDIAAEVARYEAVVRERRIDLGLIGIGENGHLAFNDPHVAQFDDPHAVKLVDIDETSRAQQVREGAFPDLLTVPRQALTITMSALLDAGRLSVVVPGAHKAGAVARTLVGPVSEACPASALRRHHAANLYLEQASFTATREQLAAAR